MSKRPDPGAGQDWILRSRDLLQRSADELDGASRSRLNRARQAALEHVAARPAASAAWRWLGAGAITAGVALMLWQALPAEWRRQAEPAAPIARLAPSPAAVPAPAPPPAPARAETAPISAPDFELLADGGQFALVEDLEFYAWLESAEASDG